MKRQNYSLDEFRIRPSNRLRHYLRLSHFLALIASWANGLPISFKILLTVALFGHYLGISKRIGKQEVSLEHSVGKGWQITVDNQTEAIDILPSSVLTTFAIWLHYRIQSDATKFWIRKKTVLILKDSVSKDDFRRLSVKLRVTVQRK